MNGSTQQYKVNKKRTNLLYIVFLFVCFSLWLMNKVAET